MSRFNKRLYDLAAKVKMPVEKLFMLVAREQAEHPQLSQRQALKIVEQHLTGGGMKKRAKIYCPRCKEEIWDRASGSKLNKCWNCMLAFDEGLTRKNPHVHRVIGTVNTVSGPDIIRNDEPKYEVIVGNIGRVYAGNDLMRAAATFHEYQDQSRRGYGLATGESVTMFRAGEIFKEHQGSVENPSGPHGRGIARAWQGSPAKFVSKPGDYGRVGYSELAMSTRIAGKRIVQYALFMEHEGEAGQAYVLWAQVRTDDGRITDGLPGEVLSPEIMRKHELYGGPHAMGRKNPLSHKETIRLMQDAAFSLREARRFSPGSGERHFHAGEAVDTGLAVARYGRPKPKAQVKAVALSVRANRARKAAMSNPPGSKVIGRKCTKIVAGNVVVDCKMGSVVGLKDGTVFIRGFFPKLPAGRIREIWYMDEAKAKREGQANPSLPWRHDFSSLDVRAWRVRGGILLSAKKPLWGMR